MTVLRHYRMDSAEGKGGDLERALAALAGALKDVPGFEGADVFCDADEPGRFIFIEKWSSIEAHKQGAAFLPKHAFTSVMAAIAGKPEACYLIPLPLA